MQMRPDVQIQSVVKALTDVILPAIDPDNKLAQEQVRLAIGLLGLMGKQLPLQFRFDCDELTRLIAFASALEGQAGAAADALPAAREAGAEVLERAKADPAEVTAAVQRLRAATSGVIGRVFGQDDTAVQDRVQATVLAMSAEQLLRERAWLKSQGWEPDPGAIPDIEQLLAPVAR